MSKANRISVAEYVTQQINICGRSQVEIATDVGYDKPNVITMIKQGKTKLPINKVPAFAKAVGVDPTHLLRIVIGEYMPETWAVLEGLIGKAMVSEQENVVLDIVRTVAGGQAVAPETEEDVAELVVLVSKWKKRSDDAADAARRRKEKEKGSSVAIG